MLGHVHGGQPTVILRRKSECLDMCTDAPLTMILHSIKFCNYCNVCNCMLTLLFLELISPAKNNSVFLYVQKCFWNYLTTYICNYFVGNGIPSCFHRAASTRMFPRSCPSEESKRPTFLEEIVHSPSLSIAFHDTPSSLLAFSIATTAAAVWHTRWTPCSEFVSQHSPFHCAGRLETRETCTRVGLLDPCKYPSTVRPKNKI